MRGRVLHHGQPPANIGLQKALINRKRHRMASQSNTMMANQNVTEVM